LFLKTVLKVKVITPSEIVPKPPDSESNPMVQKEIEMVKEAEKKALNIISNAEKKAETIIKNIKAKVETERKQALSSYREEMENKKNVAFNEIAAEAAAIREEGKKEAQDVATRGTSSLDLAASHIAKRIIGV
jgi:F0F1-type ATP synthase membrane subunit b/b'